MGVPAPLHRRGPRRIWPHGAAALAFDPRNQLSGRHGGGGGGGGRGGGPRGPRTPRPRAIGPGGHQHHIGAPHPDPPHIAGQLRSGQSARKFPVPQNRPSRAEPIIDHQPRGHRSGLPRVSSCGVIPQRSSVISDGAARAAPRSRPRRWRRTSASARLPVPASDLVLQKGALLGVERGRSCFSTGCARLVRQAAPYCSSRR